MHVARFGRKFDAQGVLAGSRDSARCIGYLTKYLTKRVADCHQATTDAQYAHAERLADALRYEPCSPTCANWLRYGVQPHNARASPRPLTARPTRSTATASCPGLPQVVRQDPRRPPRRPQSLAPGHPRPHRPDPARYTWEPVTPGDPDHMPPAQRLLHVVADRQRWHAALTNARARASGQNRPRTFGNRESRMTTRPKASPPTGCSPSPRPPNYSAPPSDSPGGSSSSAASGSSGSADTSESPNPHSASSSPPGSSSPSPLGKEGNRMTRNADSAGSGDCHLADGKRATPDPTASTGQPTRPSPARDAEVWLTLKEAEIRHGDWTDPDRGEGSVRHTETWIAVLSANRRAVPGPAQEPSVRPSPAWTSATSARRHPTLAEGAPGRRASAEATIRPGHCGQGVSAATCHPEHRCG